MKNKAMLFYLFPCVFLSIWLRLRNITVYSQDGHRHELEAELLRTFLDFWLYQVSYCKYIHIT